MADSAARGQERTFHSGPLDTARRQGAGDRTRILSVERLRSRQRQATLVGWRALVRDEIDAGHERGRRLCERIRRAREQSGEPGADHDDRGRVQGRRKRGRQARPRGDAARQQESRRADGSGGGRSRWRPHAVA